MLPRFTGALEALGRAQLAAGDANQALGSFGKLVSLQPSAARPLVLQSEAYAATKDWRNARAALQKALNIEPDSRPIWLALVAMDSRAGNVDVAVQRHAISRRQYRRRWWATSRKPTSMPRKSA
ncbi:MAG: tetratricopeptide repeat protein [Burkholderiales bacterium]|nr:tetratricopeptide repeat protein [Burkholderiales bacterium]